MPSHIKFLTTFLLIILFLVNSQLITSSVFFSVLTIVKSGTGSGTITSSPEGINCGSTCDSSFTSGTIITLTATPITGSVFAGWSGDSCMGTGPCNITLNSNITVNALFNLIGESSTTTFNLSISKAGSGSGTVTGYLPTGGINCGTVCSATVIAGTNVSLSASNNPDSTFTGWSGDCSGISSCSFIINSNISITANFDSSGSGLSDNINMVSPTTYAVTINKTGVGSGTINSFPLGIICGSVCSKTFSAGTQVTLSAVASSYSIFGGWIGGSCSGLLSTCTFFANSDINITAVFNPLTAPILVSLPTISSIDPIRGYNDIQNLDVTIYGANFLDSPTNHISVQLTKAGEPSIQGSNTVVVNPGVAVTTFDLSNRVGVFSLKLVNPDGNIAILNNIFTIELPSLDEDIPLPPPGPAPIISLISPDAASNEFLEEGVRTIITGANFGLQSFPILILGPIDQAENYIEPIALDIAEADQKHIIAIWDFYGMPLGSYNLVVLNEDGQFAQLNNAINIVEASLRTSQGILRNKLTEKILPDSGLEYILSFLPDFDGNEERDPLPLMAMEDEDDFFLEEELIYDSVESSLVEPSEAGEEMFSLTSFNWWDTILITTRGKILNFGNNFLNIVDYIRS